MPAQAIPSGTWAFEIVHARGEYFRSFKIEGCHAHFDVPFLISVSICDSAAKSLFRHRFTQIKKDKTQMVPGLLWTPGKHL